jgi:hypothetical protein
MSATLSGITHALVSVPKREDSEQSGIRASVSLCYGPGDDTAIANIHYVKGMAGMTWTVPHVEIVEDGRKVWSPVFRGELLEKLCDAASRALDRVKEQIGTPKWDTSYRVFGTPDHQVKVEEAQ